MKGRDGKRNSDNFILHNMELIVQSKMGGQKSKRQKAQLKIIMATTGGIKNNTNQCWGTFHKGEWKCTGKGMGGGNFTFQFNSCIIA